MNPNGNYILSIDPGFRNYGYAICDISSGLQLISAGDVMNNKSLGSIYYNVRDLITTYKPLHIIVEKIFINNNGKSSLCLNAGRTIPILLAELFEIPLTEIAPTSLKKGLLNDGHGKKELIQELVIRQFNVDMSHNGCDAIALCIQYYQSILRKTL